VCSSRRLKIFVKSAATAEEKAALQQQKEKQQKADLARLQQAK
jgi:hypothetical protein